MELVQIWDGLFYPVCFHGYPNQDPNSMCLLRYIPPDQEGLTTGNKLAGKHPLGTRARNLRTAGALVVRFEMPFAVWCTNCKPHETLIGQGVRFNAEKKRVGNYYSTPIYSFRMKHTACGGWIEIRTDPRNTAYTVTEGGRKRDTGEDRALALGEEEIRIRLPGEAAEEDPLARLEGKSEDRRRAETATSRILDLQERQKRDWEDPYEKSRKLRRAFRVERMSLERAEANREALKDKMSLGIDVVDETEEDRLRAQMVDFGNDGAGGGHDAIDSVTSAAPRSTRLRPMFDNWQQRASSSSPALAGSHNPRRRAARPSKPANLVGDPKEALRDELMGNTRAAVDPFFADNWHPESKKRKPTVQNKLIPASRISKHINRKGPSNSSASGEVQTGKNAPAALVHYASDSE